MTHFSGSVTSRPSSPDGAFNPLVEEEAVLYTTNHVAQRALAEDRGSISLLQAAQRRDTQRVRELLEKGVDPNSSDSENKTALIYAVYDLGLSLGDTRKTPLEVVKVLLAAGADPNVMSSDGSTALIESVEKGDLAVVKALLERGADPHAVNAEAIALAKASKNKDRDEILTSLSEAEDQRCVAELFATLLPGVRG